MVGSILLVGTGALATLFAARLSAAGIHVLIMGNWAEGLKALEQTGARLDNSLPQRVSVVRNPCELEGIKLAIILVKSWQTEHAAQQLAQCLDEDGVAITLQNGLGNDETLGRVLGDKRVSRGVTTLGATLLEAGHVHLGGDGAVFIEKSDRTAEAARLLQEARFNLHIVQDILPPIWGKLVINSAINPLSAVLNLLNGELIENAPAKTLLHTLVSESARVADAHGIRLPYADPIRMVDEVCQASAGNASSMLQDIQRGSRTEIDSINGKIIEAAEAAGVPTPYNHAMRALIGAISLRGKI